MRSLTSFGLTNTRVVVSVMILLLAAGAFVFQSFPKREDPAITVRTAIVAAANPGLTLEQLEELVARPLEEAARAIAGIDEVRTRLVDGTASLEVDIEDAIAEGDIERVFEVIRNDMGSLARTMPDGTQGPIVETDFGDVAIATIALTGEGFSYAQLEPLAEDLRDRLYALDAVAAVDLFGTQDERIWLEVSRDRLATVASTIDPVVATLEDQNVRLPAGSIVSDGVRIALETTGDFRSVDDIADTLVEIPDVGLLRLSDLVSVRRGYADPLEDPVYFDGEQAILLSVEMQDGEDIVEVGERLRAIVADFEQEQPIGVSATFSTFQPEVVDDSVSGALANMAQTFAVVFLVVLAFLGLRQALIIASIVPFAVAFAFVGMGPLGIELQQVSIAAIIISLGLLVDNGVVIVEDMDRRIREGAARHEAAIAAGKQYTVPLLIASTTTVAAFLPLFLLDGTEGQYGYSLGAVVALMLTGSFFSAVVILPLLAVWLLPTPSDARKSPFDRLADGYAWLVSVAIRVPIVAIALCFGAVAFGIMQFGSVAQQLFPLSERDQFLVYMDLSPGTDIARTQETALALSAWLGEDDANPEVDNVTTFVGFGGPRFVLTLDPADSDPASAFFIVNTHTYEGSSAAIARLRKHAANALPDARLRVKRLAMGGREPGVDVEVSGPDADVLLDVAYKVEAAFASAPSLVQNRNDWGARKLRSRVVVAQDQAREYGLTSKTISQALEGFFDGREVSVLREGDDTIPIMLRGTPDSRDSFEDLRNASLDADGTLLALDQFASVEPSLEFSSVRRVDQRRMVTISAISGALTAYELADHIRPTLDELAAELGPAYTIEIAGEVEQAGEVRQKLGAGAPIAATVMLLALMAQFNSFRRVGLTLLTVPLVIAGVPLALNAFGQPMSFFGTLGLIALSGIIINNAIVLIDQIDIERAERALNEAIVEAARKRFRPILLTSLTTVLGLAPMAVAGGALWEPMATLMMGGLAVGSLLTLIYVPSLYRLFFRERRAAAGDAASPSEPASSPAPAQASASHSAA